MMANVYQSLCDMSDIWIDITHSLQKYKPLCKTDKTENYEIFFSKTLRLKLSPVPYIQQILNECKFQKLQMRASYFFSSLFFYSWRSKVRFFFEKVLNLFFGGCVITGYTVQFKYDLNDKPQWFYTVTKLSKIIVLFHLTNLILSMLEISSYFKGIWQYSFIWYFLLQQQQNVVNGL